MPTVAILGAGMWGTTMCALLGNRIPTVLWARRAGLAAEMNRTRHNPDYLPSIRLPEMVRATASLDDAVAGAEVIVMAVPSHGFRAILDTAAPHIRGGTPVVSLTKGLEQKTLKRMTEVVAEVVPSSPRAVLTGPNLAGEIAAGYPTASVVAVVSGSSVDGGLARELQVLFSTESFRVYTNDDLVGCELGGALKNVMAIASGIADGMGFGDNTRAALVTRGLAELSRLGVALGGQSLTFAGLAGMGDLVATCISRHSRNRWVGEQLGAGLGIDDITAQTRMVAEGIRTSQAALALGIAHGVETPIAEQVVAVIHEGRSAADALSSLMNRVMKPELQGITPPVDAGSASR